MPAKTHVKTCQVSQVDDHFEKEGNIHHRGVHKVKASENAEEGQRCSMVHKGYFATRMGRFSRGYAWHGEGGSIEAQEVRLKLRAA
jgi:hypothetical protein